MRPTQKEKAEILKTTNSAKSAEGKLMRTIIRCSEFQEETQPKIVSTVDNGLEVDELEQMDLGEKVENTYRYWNTIPDLSDGIPDGIGDDAEEQIDLEEIRLNADFASDSELDLLEPDDTPDLSGGI